MALSVSNVWPLEKYARFIPDKDVTLLPSAKDTAKKGGSWRHFSSAKDCGIQLSLVDSSHFLISSGHQIYESFALWEAHKWIKGVTKGDSILFICQVKNENRRFRVKFSGQDPNKTPLQVCNECISKMSDLLPIQKMDMASSSNVSSLQRTSKPKSSEIVASKHIPHDYEDSQMFSQEPMSIAPSAVRPPGPSTDQLLYADNQYTPAADKSNETELSGQKISVPVELTPLSALAEAISSKGTVLGKAYVDTNFPLTQLGDFIRLCLTDSNFPSFVEAVEREMTSITK